MAKGKRRNPACWTSPQSIHLLVSLLLTGCFLSPPPNPTFRDYQGKWQVYESNSTEMAIGDILEFQDSTLFVYHADSTEDPSLKENYGSPYVQEKKVSLKFTEGGSMVTKSLFFLYHFTIRKGILEQGTISQELSVKSRRFTGEFPPEGWAWPPTWKLQR